MSTTPPQTESFLEYKEWFENHHEPLTLEYRVNYNVAAKDHILSAHCNECQCHPWRMGAEESERSDFGLSELLYALKVLFSFQNFCHFFSISRKLYSIV